MLFKYPYYMFTNKQSNYWNSQSGIPYMISIFLVYSHIVPDGLLWIAMEHKPMDQYRMASKQTSTMESSYFWDTCRLLIWNLSPWVERLWSVLNGFIHQQKTFLGLHPPIIRNVSATCHVALISHVLSPSRRVRKTNTIWLIYVESPLAWGYQDIRISSIRNLESYRSPFGTNPRSSFQWLLVTES